MIQQDYIYKGIAILVALLIYRWVWKKSANLALILLFVSLIVTILVYGLSLIHI